MMRYTSASSCWQYSDHEIYISRYIVLVKATPLFRYFQLKSLEFLAIRINIIILEGIFCYCNVFSDFSFKYSVVCFEAKFEENQ